MVDVWSGPMTCKVWVGEVVLNMYVDYWKAANLQMGQEQNIPAPSEHLTRLSDTVGSSPLPSVEETSEDEMDAADVAASTPLLPEEEDEFRLRCSGYKRWAILWYMPPVSEAESEELDL
eukprot:g45261.t1